MSAIDLGPRYERLRELGSGGMGQVFLVRDLYLQRELALKLLHEAPGSREDLEAFQREFALLTEIEHPRVARAYDFGFSDGKPFFTSEHVPGATLAELGSIEDGGHLLEIAIETADALAFLHASGILHLDVKASNLILASGQRRGPVLIDFGLFRRGLAGPPGTRIRGSLPYMAPEHFSGAPLTARADVYAFGVLLYRISTGTFPRAGPAEGASRLGDEAAWSPAPRAPSELGPLPPCLDGVVLRCLALEPGARYASAGEVLEALRRAGAAGSPGATVEASVASLTGREHELAETDAFLRAIETRADAPPVLLLAAAQGMGSTHFLREMKVRAQTRGLEFYLETGYPGRAGPPGSLLRVLSAHGTRGSSGADSAWSGFLARLARPKRSVPIEASEGERRSRRAAAVNGAASAVTSPMVIAVDGLQHWDEVSIALFFDLARFLCDKSAEVRPPIGLVAAYREEGSAAALLSELTAFLLEPGRAAVISLGPLGLRQTISLHRERAPPGHEAAGLALYQRTRGAPAEIVALARRGRDAAGGGAAGGAPLDSGSLREPGRTVLATLRLLDRPATARDLARFSGVSAKRVEGALEALERDGLVLPFASAAGTEWIPSDARVASPSLLTRGEERRRHGAIARAIIARRREGAALVEAVRHFRAAGSSRDVRRHGMTAARYLKSTHQNRAAIEVLRAVLEATPERLAETRIEAALEAAGLHARVGEPAEGIRLLRGLLPRARRLRGPAYPRTLLRLACLHIQSGDFRRADALFHEADRIARGNRSLGIEERLTLLNEHAGLKVIIGEHDTAVRLCEEGLRLAGRSRKSSLREAALNLHATRANVSLRTADFEGAIQSYLSSLEIAEALGSPTNQAAILNNLGIVYNQCDRYEEAITAFREAERTSIHLEEGPSLASIYGNLAVLHSKTGDFEAMERALEAGERLVPVAIGRRQEFFLKHARGLASLNRGRFAEARAALEQAIAMGTAMGDHHVTAFDEVYRAEALVFEGDYATANAELERLSGRDLPPRVQRMALARGAFIAAIVGCRRRIDSAVERHAIVGCERPIPFLDAWEDLYLAWAFALDGRREEAGRRLEPAARFFAGHGLAPAASLARWVLAESALLARDAPASAGAIRSAMPPSSRPATDLIVALGSLLEARLILASASGAGDRARASDLLAGASAAFALGPALEWSLRADALRALLRPDRVAALAAVEERRREIARRLPEELREGYLDSHCWKTWTSIAVPEAALPIERTQDCGGRTTASLRTGVDASIRSRLVARSSAMRRVLSALDALRGKDLPVLIRGETGTGKELVARIIHAESPRAAGPFRVLDCATVPPSLLESELFGARAGAFTGLEEDRPGLLASAAGGCVFIDEIGGAPLETQSKLLRVLAGGRVRPLGAEEEIRIDVRFLFSTSRDLDAEAARGAFRSELLFRIRVMTVDVPALRDRPEDFEGLVAAAFADDGVPPPVLGPGALGRLREMPWPGNVRELRSFLQRLRLESPEGLTEEAVVAARAEPKTASLFPKNLLAGERLESLQARLERDYLVYHFRRLDCDTEALREFLGVGKRQLYRRCARLGLVLRRVKRE